MKNIWTGLCLIFCLQLSYAGNILPSFFTKNYKQIPAGKIKLDDVVHDISSFYMYQSEITNLEYRAFLSDVSSHLSAEAIKSLTPIDSPLDVYFTHSDFDGYPVVGISKEAAEQYCIWLGQKLAISFDMDPSHIQVTLPSRVQWTYAAKAGNDLQIYSWEGPYLRNSEGKFLVNFNRSLGHENIKWNSTTQAYEVLSTGPTLSDFTMPVKSLLPNQWGLYNMCGNVAELVSDQDWACGGSYLSAGYDVRAESYTSSPNPTPAIGFRPIVVIK
jgi:formylglycine-generating enzyme required for sulfatase activity